MNTYTHPHTGAGHKHRAPHHNSRRNRSRNSRRQQAQQPSFLQPSPASFLQDIIRGVKRASVATICLSGTLALAVQLTALMR